MKKYGLVTFLILLFVCEAKATRKKLELLGESSQPLVTTPLASVSQTTKVDDKSLCDDAVVDPASLKSDQALPAETRGSVSSRIEYVKVGYPMDTEYLGMKELFEVGHQRTDYKYGFAGPLKPTVVPFNPPPSFGYIEFGPEQTFVEQTDLTFERSFS
jgi:hypothetical protein